MLALGGIAAPALFAGVVLVAASLRPDYSHVAQLISELGATGTPHAALMNYGGFVPGGILLVGFSVALARVLPRSRVSIVSASLVAAFGCGVATSGVVSCDPGCPQTGGSLENLIHDRIAPLSFLCLIVAAGMLGVRFRSLPGWRPLGAYSLVTSAVALGLLIALAGSLETRVWTGLWQRLLVATLFLWCAIVGHRVFGASSEDPGAG